MFPFVISQMALEHAVIVVVFGESEYPRHPSGSSTVLGKAVVYE